MWLTRTVNGVTRFDHDGAAVPPSDPWQGAPLEPGWPVFPEVVADDLPRRPWWRRWWLLAVPVIAMVAAGVALWPSGSHPEPAKIVPVVAVSSPAPSAASSVLVVYEVTSSGAEDIGSVQYTDQDGDIISRNGVRLPWRVTFRVTGPQHAFVVISQRKKGGTGPVTCSITVGGKVLSTTTQSGRYAAPQCSG